MDPVLIPPMAPQSAVLVAVPEAEQAVGGHRDRLDRAAAWGVPAHVTVLYPFVAPSAITAAVVAGVAGAVGSVRAFGCEFAATAWFGEEAVWLAPRPDEPFRALTRAVSAAFPGYLPYGGAYDEVIPHLTIGDRPAGGVTELRAAEADVLRWLPIQARISRAWLMTGNAAPGSWQTVAELPLAAG
jgi:2'-5' RNA ligase superfamily protein